MNELNDLETDNGDGVHDMAIDYDCHISPDELSIWHFVPAMATFGFALCESAVS